MHNGPAYMPIPTKIDTRAIAHKAALSQAWNIRPRIMIAAGGKTMASKYNTTALSLGRQRNKWARTRSGSYIMLSHS